MELKEWRTYDYVRWMGFVRIKKEKRGHFEEEENLFSRNGRKTHETRLFPDAVRR